MKRVACILVALVCVFGFALAEVGQLSSTVGNSFFGSHVTAANVEDAEAKGLYLRPVNEYYEELSEEEYERLMSEVEIELEKMAEAASITDYFGDVYVSSTGEQMPLIELFDGKQPDVNEFEPVVAGGFDLSYGEVTADLIFPTPYELDEQVAVLIGVIFVDDNEEQHMTWVAHKGVGVKIPELSDTDGIEVTFRPEMVDMMQSRDTIVAVASEHHDAEQE